VLCEYDALPGMGHACGHNVIATMGAGAGFALAPLMADLPGRLVVIGTPAEEGGGGKVLLLDAGVFDDVDAAR
jgi:metal-dependent amidase/aminoacylase/carboxypeptidase family protein